MPKIRLASPHDATNMLQIYRPLIENSVISFEFSTPTIEQFAGRIDTVLKRYPWLVCTWQDTLAGYAYGGPHRRREAYQWSVEWSVYVHEGFQRKGIARALYQSLEAILIRQGFRNALAGITLPNPASVAFHEAYGFTPVGVYRDVGFKQDAWRSVGWWEKRIGPQHKPPTDPVPLSETVKDPEFHKDLDQGLSSIKRGAK
ncbi:MAG: GNAT family N-acetyltransferase [Cyclobacteriaceae bacterium]|nr:GNAT family N-acetyltransferase [Cyclobacteriaceae bacterium]